MSKHTGIERVDREVERLYLDKRKGVIVKVLPDEDMPRDSAGNYAKVISAPEATANRMNLSRPYSHFHGAAARDLTSELIADSGLKKGVSKEVIEMMDEALFNKVYKKLMLYYYCVSPWQQEMFTNLPLKEKQQHLYDVFKDGVYPFMPVDSPRKVKDAANLLRRNFKQVYGPVTYVGNSGRRSVTKRPVRIGPMYYMLLDKTATEWSSTSTARLQIFGILTPLTKSEKFARPYRDSPTRTIGETEGRIYSCYGGRRMTAELFDRSNNPAVQKAISWRLLTEEEPGNIDQLVDREQHPYGNSRNRLNMLHILNVAGMTITYRPEDEDKK